MNDIKHGDLISENEFHFNIGICDLCVPDKMKAFPLRLCILKLPSLPMTTISPLDNRLAV